MNTPEDIVGSNALHAEVSPSFLAILRGGVSSSPVTKFLILANLAVFVAMLAAGAGMWHSENSVQLAWGANFRPATTDGEWWRLATAMFLHFGVVHLTVNMAALWDVGRFVERIHGHARFLAIYVIAGLSGNLLSLAVHGHGVVSGGASGAVFGVYGALLMAIWRERHTLKASEFRWIYWGAFGFTGANIVFGFVIPGIDNGAHIGGLISGALAGLALMPRQTATRRGVAIVALILMLTAIALRIPTPDYSWRGEQQARSGIRSFLWEDALLSRHWETVIGDSRRKGMTFDEIANRIESEIAAPYEQSFEALSSIKVQPKAPSGETLEALKRYAELRRDASHELADALRSGDAAEANKALAKAKAAKALAGAAPKPPTPATPAAATHAAEPKHSPPR